MDYSSGESEESESEPEQAWMTESHRKDYKMNHKQAPGYDGQSMSFFEYEDLVRDWVEGTTIDAGKIGPQLKNALTGQCNMYKDQFDREKLKNTNTDEMLDYFFSVLRPKFLKGAPQVFIWRFLKMFTFKRNHGEPMHIFIEKWRYADRPYHTNDIKERTFS